MATIGWIDFSANDRDRVGSVLDLLRPEGMVDELGLGTLRDGMANQLFPGISTIQTRAKYFFIVPYILLEYQSAKPQQRKGKTPSKYLEEREYEVMWALAEKYSHEEGNGVIGITKKKPNKIMRRPSTIYWNGLFTYRFIATQGLGAESFLKQAAKPTVESLLSSVQKGDDSTGDDADAEHDNLFQIKVSPKVNWDIDLTLDLSEEEAQFFKDRISTAAKNKLISSLLSDKDLWDLAAKTEKGFMQFARAGVTLEMSDNLRHNLILAHDFSELMYGAHLAYNCQLQTRIFGKNSFGKEWDSWVNDIQKNMIDYANFNPELIFGYAKSTRPTTLEFVRNWWSLTKSKFPDLKQKNSLILQQEADVKPGKARLRWSKFDDVKEDTWVGLTHFDYRFTQGRNILTDIRNALI